MSVSRRDFIQTTSAALLLGGFASSSSAQAVEAARVVIGFAPGGTIDLAGRRIAEKLAPGYARTAIVENRTGAGGQIAVQAVKSAAPDGATLLVTPSSPISLHMFTYRKLPYDVAELAPVSGAASFDYALAVGPVVPASVNTLTEFLARARANPAQANFGTAGNGSAAHFLGAALAREGKADIKHVAFRGSQPAIVDMIGGQIAAVIGPTGEFMPNVKAGKIRLIATSGPKRGKFTPEVATFVDNGFKDLGYVGWFGVYVPAKTPPEIIRSLNAAVRAGLNAPDTVASLATAYMEPWPTSPEQLAGSLKTETEFWAGMVRTVGYTPEG